MIFLGFPIKCSQLSTVCKKCIPFQDKCSPVFFSLLTRKQWPHNSKKRKGFVMPPFGFKDVSPNSFVLLLILGDNSLSRAFWCFEISVVTLVWQFVWRCFIYSFCFIHNDFLFPLLVLSLLAIVSFSPHSISYTLFFLFSHSMLLSFDRLASECDNNAKMQQMRNRIIPSHLRSIVKYCAKSYDSSVSLLCQTNTNDYKFILSSRDVIRWENVVTKIKWWH